MPPISDSDFQALLKQTGIPLTAAQEATLREGYAFVETMLADLQKPAGRDPELAHVFNPEQRS